MRGLATALVVLREALIRTGIGAAVVGAGELIYQFTKLVRGAGGFREALELMGNVAKAVWDGIKVTATSFVDDFRAMRADIEEIWLRLMALLSQIGPTFNAVSKRIGADARVDVFGRKATCPTWTISPAMPAIPLRFQAIAGGERRHGLQPECGGKRDVNVGDFAEGPWFPWFRSALDHM